MQTTVICAATALAVGLCVLHLRWGIRPAVVLGCLWAAGVWCLLGILAS